MTATEPTTDRGGAVPEPRAGVLVRRRTPSSTTRRGPRYPDALIDDLVARARRRRVLDVGCGTGLLGRGCSSSAGVDGPRRRARRPDGRGRARGTAWPSRSRRSRTGSRAGDASSCWVAGQAWHWVDPDARRTKAASSSRRVARSRSSGTTPRWTRPARVARRGLRCGSHDGKARRRSSAPPVEQAGGVAAARTTALVGNWRVRGPRRTGVPVGAARTPTDEWLAQLETHSDHHADGNRPSARSSSTRCAP